MIRKDKDEYICECEDCGDQLYGGTTEEFMAFVEQVKKEGWRIRKDQGGEWVHICPICSEDT